ncbi:hypothetical protein LWI29_000872 [Acer saccharum]|uniref:HAT C-terminal dimerisation domain-containing protein n=1 Tax=Acer saccharum TaxID=4024 RepID=A0AA39RTE8_ACESA|nr:hypothetical protein LWI29_000872 [Acer saccharum]
MREEKIDHCVTLNSLSKKGSSSGSVTDRGIRGPMDRFVMNVENEVVEDLEGNEKGMKGLEKEARENTCMDIADFFYENGLAFNVASSPSFTKMLRSVGSYGRGLKPPTAYELSTSLLIKGESNTQAIVDEVKKTWSQTGVSIMSDGWKDIRGRQLINFLVNNPHGTVFLKSIDASDVVKDATLLFNLLDSVVEEVGEDYVVQVVSNFIYNHGWVLALMRNHTKKELIRPAPTRFATAFLTLDRMLSLRQPLEHMFTSKEWDGCSWAKKAEGKEIKKIIFNDNFWGSMSYALKTTRPLVSVLRMTDSEQMPAMGFIYGAMDKAKEEIAANLGNEEGAYKEIWKIIDEKWEFQLHRHLHAAAYYLNPRIQYSDGLSTHLEVKIGLMVCMEKLIPDEEERVRANLQLNLFKNKQGFFAYGRAKNLIENLSPADWWSAYGDEAPELRSFAVKILSLTCSSSACERNWSTFNLVHTKKRNRLSTKKLNSLVYIMYNKKLQNRFLKKKALKDDDEPLVTEYVPSDDEWMVGEDVVEGTSTDVDMSQPSGSRQVGEKRKRNTTKGKAMQRVDGEEGWEDISNQYNSPGTSDDDDEGDYSFDPRFKPIDTNDSLWDGLD